MNLERMKFNCLYRYKSSAIIDLSDIKECKEMTKLEVLKVSPYQYMTMSDLLHRFS